MNQSKHLTTFYEKAANDKNINPSHISLYMAIFQVWKCNQYKNPVSINRNELMSSSKINSKATYHKCMKKLHALGYIIYQPSFNPFKGSNVIIETLQDIAVEIQKDKQNK